MVERAALAVVMSMRSLMSNFTFISPTTGEYSFDQLLDLAQRMDMEKLLLIKGRILAKVFKERTEFDKTFMRVYKTIMEVRELQNKTHGLCFNAFKPSMTIIPLDKMVNLSEQLGTRLKEVALTTETFNLTQLFTKPLLTKHGIVILGASSTTGYGKTQFALRLAVEWAKAYNQVMQLPKEDAVVVFSNTLDVAKEVRFKPGYIWVLDELNPADQTQAIHMSENMMKVLMAPTAPGSIRCRNADLVLPAGVPRLFTANAETAQEWVGNRMRWTEPIQRKTVVFVVKSPLVPDSWRNQNATSPLTP